MERKLGISSGSNRWFLASFDVCSEWNCVVHFVDKPQEGLVDPSCVDGSVGQLVPQERVHERVVEQTVALLSCR